MALKGHEIAEVFPMLKEDRLRTLAASIATNGLRRPIVLFEGAILDGRNRYKAAKLAKYETKPKEFVEFEGDWDAAVAFGADENLERRDLDSHERTVCAARMQALKRGRPGENAPRGAFSRAAIAERFQVGERGVTRARRVLDKGSPELVAAMESKEIAIKPAAELSKLPVDQQREAVAGGPEAIKQALGWERRTELSPAQKAVRRQQRVGNAWWTFIEALARAKEALSVIAADEAAPTDEDRVTAWMAIRDTRSTLDWAESLLRGGVSDAALKDFVQGHPNE